MRYSCVEDCKEGYVEIFNRCWMKNDSLTEVSKNFSVFQKMTQQLVVTWPNLVEVCGIAFVFSYIVLILFRYFIEYVIWIIYVLFIGIFVGAAGFSLYAHITAKEEDKLGLLILTMFLSIFVIVFVFMLILNRKKIRLIAQIFKEASKALIDVPMLLFEPILTFIALVLAFLLFMYFVVVTETTGKLTSSASSDGEFQAAYKPLFVVYVSRIFNPLLFIWFTQFTFGCQNFVIGGTVVKWYFTRDKSKLVSPMKKTFVHLTRFHLGSVCLGSILIMLVKVLKFIVDGIKAQTRNSTSFPAQCLGCLCSCLINKLDQFLQYLMRNAYIIMAKDGTPFFESGKKAFKLIFRNLGNVVALNHFGDLVLFMGRLFVVLIAGLCGYALMVSG
ncbi:choline transporter-like protein 1 [Chironomus tepperi]|uniref:choline transporter-like protein 1 n=1 Tax=Chironomus tepperi TaxID=113505 RepID=UPI00391EF986